MATGEEEMESILLGEVFGQLTAVWCKYGASLAAENFLDVEVKTVVSLCILDKRASVALQGEWSA